MLNRSVPRVTGRRTGTCGSHASRPACSGASCAPPRIQYPVAESIPDPGRRGVASTRTEHRLAEDPHMKMTGIYRIVLTPSAEEQAFVKHMETKVFTASGVLQPTRITSHFSHVLLKSQGSPAQFAWVVT